MESFEKHTNSAEQIKVEQGLLTMTDLAQREARGEDVTKEIDALANELIHLTHVELIQKAYNQGIQNEFGDKLDPARFELNTHERWRQRYNLGIE